MKKGQVSLEYMFAIGAIMLMFALVAFISDFSNEGNRRYDSLMTAYSKCTEIATAISSAYTSGSSTSINISAINYNVSVVDNGSIVVQSLIQNSSVASCNYLARLAI